MSLQLARLNPDALKEDPKVDAALRQFAGEVAREANRTSAPIGITYRRTEPGVVRIGPRGAAALPLEVGTSRIPARRYVKNALDRRRLR